ncbi:MAG TPA: nucleoside hydrolase [Pyrinomonadaceae bacterium]|jgi:inosine-uridine nucleoside N-ribohydrolase|nr:nucleoside hydrolase [Pyrinomonadaceae bacterium]
MKLHIDTDIGGDIDDLCALALALKWPGAELVGVTTVAEHAGRRAGYARYALGLEGRADVPVAAGADASGGFYREFPLLPKGEDAYWPGGVESCPTPLEDALDLLERNIRQGATVCAIGPFTNLALLERRSPGILGEARLCMMGGFVFPPREGFPAWDYRRDYNVQVDAERARLVFDSASGPTLVTLAVTAETALRGSQLEALEGAGPLARLVARQAEVYAAAEHREKEYARNYAGLPEDFINYQHDPLACAVALGWDEGVRVEELPLNSTIEDGWLVQRVEEGGRPAEVVTRVDGRAFEDFWLRTVTRD